ncbi:hypothetical protein [Christiangramia sp.]|uniref:hypothetical protein n=1 Tax=Christiangramia sp. TaxID=1931228 RepID=UPI002615537F|nr:hypothetical protein [Christiangramia sp.]
MSEEDKNKKADWQKNSGRPSNFNEKDDGLRKDGDGNLKLEKDKKKVSEKEDESIKDTLESLSKKNEDKK